MSLSNLFGRRAPAAPPTRPAAAAQRALFTPTQQPAAAPALAPLKRGDAAPGVQAAAPAIDHFRTFQDVPRFNRVISNGEGQLSIALADEEKATLVAILLSGTNALVVHAAAEPIVIAAVRGRLSELGFMSKVATAEAAVIAAIYSAGQTSMASVSGQTRAKNTYMEQFDRWVRYALEQNATDIHIETHGTSGQVRFRIDGTMERMRAEDGGQYPAAFLISAMHAIYNNEQQSGTGSDSLFMEGQIYALIPYDRIPGRQLNLRFQSMKGAAGPKVVLRLLHIGEDRPPMTFEQMGYAQSQVRLIERAQEAPCGAVAVAGATGSGKSTFLRSFVELNPDLPSLAVYSVEDPVEYPMSIHQFPLQRDLADPEGSARSYTKVITALLRLDPDVVYLGEVRDQVSASAMQEFALTGHPTLFTVHANFLSGIVPRLVDENMQLKRTVLTAPNVLNALIFQALVPVLCPHCCADSEEAARESVTVHRILEHVRDLGLDSRAMRWKRPEGCPKCRHRGTQGLTVVAEIYQPDEHWLDLVREGNDAEALEWYRSHSDGDLHSPNMDGKTVFEHTLFKALNGQADARQCARFEAWHTFAQRTQRRRRNQSAH
ncbi:MAG: GspE/PulE family protein [Gammaproteobacteria bacterium]|uniref:GspE/PulE family protein n=1 Tax=uncultured Pseudacidovorax sp. TaxID=679313 RepID=UPI0025DE9E0E|nr:ATPase, T2SS/T4P/T4SS family [uncultured Pseudacidovorax sp.]